MTVERARVIVADRRHSCPCERFPAEQYGILLNASARGATRPDAPGQVGSPPGNRQAGDPVRVTNHAGNKSESLHQEVDEAVGRTEQYDLLDTARLTEQLARKLERYRTASAIAF